MLYNNTATFETTAQSNEAGHFQNYPSGAYTNTLPTNATTGTNSEYLNGGYRGQIGVAKSFSVMPGDQLQIQAYGKYNPPSGTGTNMTGIAAALLGAFNLAAPAAGEIGTASSALNSWGGVVSGGYSTTGDPKVFVTIILFDRDYNPVDVSYKQLKDGFMSTSYTVRKPGYAYLYVSNENPTFVDVYVDDVTVSFTPSAIIALDSYYPFGLTYNSYTRERSVLNKIKFQGQEQIDDLSLGWASFKWRNEMPELGRFFNIDPLAEKYYYNSTYAFSENKVVAHRELEGLESFGVNTAGATAISDAFGGKKHTNEEIRQIADGEIRGVAQGARAGAPLVAATLMTGNPEIAIPFMVTSLTGFPVTPSPQAMETTVASEISAVETSAASKSGSTATTKLDGSFSVKDWSGYPAGGAKPSGPFRLLEGAEYKGARELANKTNQGIRSADPAKYAGKQIHEIQPVKFGGSPTDAANKVPLTRSEHAQYTNFWNDLMRNINKKP